MRILGEHVGGTGAGDRMGRQFYGNVGEDQPQRETTLPGAAEFGEIEKCELTSGRQGEQSRRER